MIIPKEFKDILDTDMHLSGVVRLTVSRFDLILQESKFEFFPEYTKHNSSHVEAVIKNALDLIGESLSLLNARDVTVLILSILVHDLGMHITYTGFKKYIEKGNPIVVKEIDNLTWEEEWSKYLQESKKWSGKKQQEIFGEKAVLLKEPSNVKIEHSEVDKRLIGEFIRRHHPRMAHEIALVGFPIAKGDYLPFANDLEIEIKDIIGLVGRSHGMDLRSTFS